MSLPSNSDRARGDGPQAGDGLQRGGLAGAVGADERDDLALVDRRSDTPLSAWICRSRHAGRRPQAASAGAPQVGLDDPRVALDLRRRALGDLLAEVEHGDAVGDAHDQAHVVLDQQHGVARVADPRMSAMQAALLRPGSCRRRARRAGAASARWPGRGRSPAGAGRRRAGSWPRRRPGRAMPTNSSSSRPARGPRVSSLRCAGQAEHGADDAGAVVRVRADEHVLERGHVGEQPDVLERAGDAELGDLVALLAAERLAVEARPRPRSAGRRR